MKAVQGCSMKDGGATGATGPYLCVSSPFPVCASKESDQLKEFWSSSRAQLLRCTAALLLSFFSLVIHSSCPCRWPLLSPQGHRRSSAEFIHKYKEITCTEDIVRCTHPRITRVYSLMGVTADQAIVFFFFLNISLWKTWSGAWVSELPTLLHVRKQSLNSAIPHSFALSFSVFNSL